MVKRKLRKVHSALGTPGASFPLQSFAAVGLAMLWLLSSACVDSSSSKVDSGEITQHSTALSKYDRRVGSKEVLLPSQNGTCPMVSPDGQWIAYTEIGWGRPWGSGGLGRSNLRSVVHVMRKDGTDDRVVSDMFLVRWLADSKHVASIRDGFGAVSDLNANITAEFGDSYQDPGSELPFGNPPEAFQPWNKSSLQGFEGAHMPHKRRLPTTPEEFFEDQTVSADGKWFGPIITGNVVSYIGAAGGKRFFTLGGSGINTVGPFVHGNITIFSNAVYMIPPGQNPFARAGEANQSRGNSVMQTSPLPVFLPGARYVASPNDQFVAVIGGSDTAIVIDTAAKKAIPINPKPDPLPRFNSWDYRKCRWNPWSKDSSRLAFVREGQIWSASVNGEKTRQLTFDGTNKAFPTFSPDGRRIAYLVTLGELDIENLKCGPTELWVVDVATTRCSRISPAESSEIFCVDWVDNQNLVFDRVDPKAPFYTKSELKRVSLNRDSTKGGLP